jgi:hypothetical protein
VDDHYYEIKTYTLRRRRFTFRGVRSKRRKVVALCPRCGRKVPRSK